MLDTATGSDTRRGVICRVFQRLQTYSDDLAGHKRGARPNRSDRALFAGTRWLRLSETLLRGGGGRLLFRRLLERLVHGFGGAAVAGVPLALMRDDIGVDTAHCCCDAHRYLHRIVVKRVV